MGKLSIPLILLIVTILSVLMIDQPQPKADFTFTNNIGVTTLDVQRMSWMQDLRVARLLFEGLVHNDVLSREFRTIPGVAESWEVSPDNLVYTFHLRDNARWSNGKSVTASDFVYSWRRGILPDTAADYSGMFFKIQGARAFFQWRNQKLASFDPKTTTAQTLWEQTEKQFADTVKIQALDDFTLRVELESPTPYFLDLCAFSIFSPVYPPLVKQYETLDPDTGRLISERGWTKPPAVISNGPFKLTLWRFKRDMRLEKNPHYWNKETVAIDSIHIPTIEDPNAAVLAFETGALDWSSDVIPSYRADMLQAKEAFYQENASLYEKLKNQGLDPIEIDRQLPQDPRANIHAFPAFGTYFWNFNCSPRLVDGRINPFADPRVRRAFALAIDKQTIVKQVRRLGEPIASTLIPPGSIGGYASPAGLGYDPRLARELLAQAGYKDPSTMMTIELLFNKDSGHDLIGQSIARSWRENLGVSVTLRTKELKVFKDDLKKHNFMTSRAGWFGDYGDPTTFLEINRSTDGNNDRNYSNPIYDDLLDQADKELDTHKRMAILSQAEQLIMEQDLPMIPIFHYVQINLFDAHRITGISSHPRQQQDLFLVDVFGDGKGPDLPRALPPSEPILNDQPDLALSEEGSQ